MHVPITTLGGVPKVPFEGTIEKLDKYTSVVIDLKVVESLKVPIKEDARGTMQSRWLIRKKKE